MCSSHDQDCCHSHPSNQTTCHSCAHGNEETCCHSSCRTCHHDYIKEFLELANCAWMEVLKEKIKEHIRAHSPHMDELAKLISEANHERWKKKMASHECTEDLEDKLRAFFSHTCPPHGKS